MAVDRTNKPAGECIPNPRKLSVERLAHMARGGGWSRHPALQTP